MCLHCLLDREGQVSRHERSPFVVCGAGKDLGNRLLQIVSMTFNIKITTVGVDLN